MSKGKKIALIVLLILAFLAAAGFFGYLKFQEHTKKTEVLQAMRSKYGKQFLSKSIKPIDEESFYAYLSAADIEDSLVRVKVSGGGTKLEDDYVSVRLSHEITDEVRGNLPKEDYIFIHTDNTLEFTDAGEFDPDKVSVSEYLASHPDDCFNVSVLIDSGAIKPETLRNTIGAAAYNLSTERGSLCVYALSPEEFESTKKNAIHYDSMKVSEIEEIMKNKDPILTLGFEELTFSHHLR